MNDLIDIKNGTAIPIQWDKNHRCHVLVLAESVCQNDIDELKTALEAKPNVLVIRAGVLDYEFIMENPILIHKTTQPKINMEIKEMKE